MTDLFHVVPTQTWGSFAAMNMANPAEALLIKSRKEKSAFGSEWKVKESVVVARARVKPYLLKESDYGA